MPSQPKGLSRARNAAAAACTTPFIAFIDDDARPEPQWLEAILSAFKADETLGVAFGPISLSWPDGPPDWLPTSIYPTIGALDLGPSDRKAASNERGYGGNLAFRTALIRDVGGFDERLGRSGARTLLSNDELGIQESIRARGWEIGYVAAARVHHKIAPDRVQANWFRGRIAWQAVSEVLQSADGLDTDAIRGLWDAVSSDNLLRWSHLLAPRRGETFAEQINSIHELVRLLLLTHLVDTTESHAILSEAYEKFVRAKGSAQAS
jgi:glycosyltransferase involved in cell wall biosynthesis